MARVELSVHFQCKEDDGSYIFLFPCGQRLPVLEHDVERSLPLRDMLESATNCGETTITFLSSVELTHFHIWAAAVQPDSPVFQADAERMKRSLEAVDYLADEGLIQRLAAAYAAQLLPIEPVALDAGFLKVLGSMREELASTVLAASARPAGERAWRLPERLHHLDKAITAATAAADAQRPAPGGQELPQGSGCILENVSVSPDGKFFATCGQSAHVAVWHTSTSLLVRTLQGLEAGNFPVYRCAWSPDGRQLATGIGQTGNIAVWDIATGAVKVVGTLQGPGRWVMALAWSPDGRKICAGYNCFYNRAASLHEDMARVWELSTGDVLHILDGHENAVHSAAWSPDGAYLATGLFNSSVRMWDGDTGDLARVLRVSTATGMQYRVIYVAWSPGGDILASAHANGAVRAWDTGTGTCKHTLQGSNEIVSSVAWSPDGCYLATGGWDWNVRVWEVATGKFVRVIRGGLTSGEYFTSAVRSPCGNVLFTGTNRRHIFILNVSGGQLET